MRTSHFWNQEPTPARAALYATMILLVVGLGVFVVLTVVVSVSMGVSPLQAWFGPLPGMPLIAWLVTVTVAVALQGAVALALGRRSAWLRIAGIAGAFAIAGFCLLWFASAAYGLIEVVASGTQPFGDFYDMLGVIFFGVPLGLAILGLNARAAFLGARELRRRASPVA